MKETVREIKHYRTLTRTLNRFFPALLFAHWLSPYLSAICVKRRMTPNTITILMIPAAIIASVCFALPWLPLKIVGTLFFHIWFAIDLSDGQVARYTKTFSKYGEELDYVVHHICHIFFIVSFCFNLYMLHYDISFIGVDYSIFIIGLACLMIFGEYAFRNECSIGALIRYKSGETRDSKSSQAKRGLIPFVKRMVRIVINSLNCIDNYVLLGSLLVYFDIYLGAYSLLLLSLLLILFTFLLNIKNTIFYLVLCFKGEK